MPIQLLDIVEFINSLFKIAMEVIRNNMAVRQQNDLRLYLDVIADPNKVRSPSVDLAIFLNF